MEHNQNHFKRILNEYNNMKGSPNSLISVLNTRRHLYIYKGENLVLKKPLKQFNGLHFVDDESSGKLKQIVKSLIEQPQ